LLQSNSEEIEQISFFQHLAQENGITLTHLVNIKRYHLKELQELAPSCNLDIQVIERKKIKGWTGKPKGLFQVLWETGWINPELPRSKYDKAGNKGRDFEENGKLKG
jgi:hypothetical protein